MSKSKVLSGLVGVTIILTLILVMSHSIINFILGDDNSYNDAVKENIDDTGDDIIDENDLTLTSKFENREIYDEMHKMINTKIIAEEDDIWGETPITDELCEELISYLNVSDYSDKNYLIQMLNNWKNGDFSNGVEEHNYLWKKLGGTKGKAIGLREE